ncbi:RNA polymerase sigma factor [Aminipila sp.]|uniref:RNA polymerase sigma factor n=1 Tax=Aminipila sp. TaxID=2060095 RepID=UPI00289699EC|nr:sigma-70 family RNA polymerase sigma factor [Aminipila sp.]
MIKKNSLDKLETLFIEYRQPLFFYICGIIKDECLAEDILQTVFLKLGKNIENIKSVKSKETKNYLYKIAKSTAIDYYNIRKKIYNNTQPYDEYIINIVERQAFESTSNNKIYDKLEESINKLSNKDKKIISLKYKEEWSYSELSELLKISEPATRKRISRAKKKLAVHLNKME